MTLRNFALTVSVFIALFGGFALAGNPAFALTTLKKVEVTDGDQIDLYFDGKVNPKQIRTEFFNDIIQLSLNDVSVYPAKISSVSGMDLTKVFAYQYAPKLVRCRLTVKGKAEGFEKRFRMKANGKMISIRLDDGEGSDRIVSSSAQATRAHGQDHGSSKDESPASRGNTKAKDDDSAEERALLERVMKSAPAAAVAPAREKEVARDEKREERKEEKKEALKEDKKEPVQAREQAAASSEGSREQKSARASRPLGGGKPLPSPFRSLGILGVVMALFLGLAFAAKKFRGSNLQSHKAFSGLFGKMGKIGLNARPKMIEVVSNHYLGPKKSIAVVKVGGRTLVLGVTSESINLITQLPGDASEAALDAAADDFSLDDLGISKGSGATAAGPAIFSNFLNAERGREPAGQAAPARNSAYSSQQSQPHQQQAQGPTLQQPQQAAPAASASIRAQIKSRMEGMKTL